MDTGSTPSSYEAQLPPELESVVAARRLFTDAVRLWGLGDGVLDDGALAVSELVANAVLHAGTTVEFKINRLGRGVRVEVGDGSSHLPVVEAARPEDLLANRSMTGRGLALVAATSDRWGAEPVGAGKVTWAEIGTGRRLVAAAPAPAFPPASRPPSVTAAARARGVVTRQAVTGGGRRVHLIGVPAALLLESARQMADLQREIQVMAMGRSAPPEMEPVVQAGRPWVSEIDIWTDADRRLGEQAVARGVETVDFEVLVPDDAAERIDAVTSWMSRAASAIARRYLLTLPATAEVDAYRRWCRDEILGQLSGRAPRPCPLRMRAEATRFG